MEERRGGARVSTKRAGTRPAVVGDQPGSGRCGDGGHGREPPAEGSGSTAAVDEEGGVPERQRVRIERAGSGTQEVRWVPHTAWTRARSLT